MTPNRLSSLLLLSLALSAARSARADDPISLALSDATLQRAAAPAFDGASAQLGLLGARPILAPLAPAPVQIGSSLANQTSVVGANGIGPVNTIAVGPAAVALTTITALNTNVVTNVNVQTNVVNNFGR